MCGTKSVIFTFIAARKSGYTPLHAQLTHATSPAGQNFVRVGLMTNIPNNLSCSANMHLITVNLNWTNYNRGVAIPHNRQMQTQVARYGLQNYIWGAIQ